ncbi:MAG: extracellular solute-binding protein [Oscillospiraceae bacterium]|jgi:arabinogalactan oligomer/maltooligosaccharide transport system substrate-binding protein|nr:extracellular solute-binding protein [Oscillospiraceae bacterium]
MKKFVSVLLAALMLAGLCGGAAQAENIALKVWGSQDDQALIKELCEAFAAGRPENAWAFTYGVVGEADAKARYLEDPTAAADVFSYPDDQIIDLVNADALYEVTRNHDAIVAANSAGSVNAATYGGVLYGYPMTADNGYFMYYDKSVLTEEDVQTLDGILAAANKAGKKVFMDISNGWYVASFFLGNGCTLALDEAGNQICDFNSPKGLAAAEAIRAFCNDPAFLTGDDTLLQGGIGESICAGISGTWIAAAVKERLGDNYAACKLPTFTAGGEQVQMGSFLGCKIVGVNTQTAYPVEAMDLAEYLTGEAAQIRRFEVRGYGPSNINAATSSAVSADAALSALAAQSQYGISQHVLNAYWTPAEAFGAELEAHSTADLQGLLDQLVAQTTAK